MRIGIITYKKPHKKTQLIAEHLKNNGNDIFFFFLPFQKRKKRRIFFNHRPKEFDVISNIKFCKKNLIKIYDFKKLNRIKLDHILITVGVLIDTKKIKKKIINCHSGLLPNSRGLDCFKWDIFYKKKVGVTLHYINNDIDSGEIIHKRRTKLSKQTTLKKFSEDHYFNEIELLANFYKYLNNKKKNDIIDFVQTNKNIYKRMSYNLEKKLKYNFNLYRKKYCQ